MLQTWISNRSKFKKSTGYEDSYPRQEHYPALNDQYPYSEFRVNSEDEEKAQKVFKDFEEYVLTLLTRILSLEAELCMARYKP